ncbi:MAG: DEAD/DEAH box helicase family protein [Caldilineaceae bacterium]
MAASLLTTSSAQSAENEHAEVQFASALASAHPPVPSEPPQLNRLPIPAAASLYFQGGTLVLDGVGQEHAVHPAFQWIKARWRCEAYHLPALLSWLRENRIRNSAQRWRLLNLTLHDGRQPHDFQLEALRAWDKAERLGSIVLPTGSGKTFVAIQAIKRVGASTVVVAPTIDLLHQWYARLVNAFCPAGAVQTGDAMQIGVYYGGEKQVEPITVTTYHSAGDLMAAYGNRFKLIIYDEVHHLPAPSWGDGAHGAGALPVGLDGHLPGSP